MWNVLSVPRQVQNDRTVPIIYNKGYIAHFLCACAKRPYFHFRFKIWRHRRVPRIRFPVKRGNFGDLRTFNAVMGLLLIFVCILRTSSPEIGVLGANGEEVVRCLPPTNSFLLLGFLRLCQFWCKSIKKCERERNTQTDTRTEANWFL